MRVPVFVATFVDPGTGDLTPVICHTDEATVRRATAEMIDAMELSMTVMDEKSARLSRRTIESFEFMQGTLELYPYA